MEFFYLNKIMSLFKRYLIIFSLTLMSINLVNASDDLGWWDSIKLSLKKTWESDTYELFIPVNTWHNRWTYDRENIDSYNERPWGIGIGVSRFDEDGDWHALYAMEFQDSHNVIEPIIGYGYQTYWRATDKLRLGIGYTLSITARKDYNWIPFPASLPLFSVEYDRLSIQSTYVPGIKKNTGNILFTWLRWRF